MRLIRLRRKKENLRFRDEFRIIPRWLIVLVIVLFLLAQGIALLVNLSAPQRGDQIFPPELKYDPVLASLALAGIVTAVSLVLAAFIFLIAYVNRDAKRRGMHVALWTLLALLFHLFDRLREPRRQAPRDACGFVDFTGVASFVAFPLSWCDHLFPAARTLALPLPPVWQQRWRALQLLPQLQVQPASFLPAVQARDRRDRQVLPLLRK